MSDNWIAVAPQMPVIRVGMYGAEEEHLPQRQLSSAGIEARATWARLVRVPMEFLEVKTVERFVLFQYQPLGGRDPDAIAMLGDTRPARIFNRAMLALQNARYSANPHIEPHRYYKNVEPAAERVGAALMNAEPTAAEAQMVLSWLADVRDGGWIA